MRNFSEIMSAANGETWAIKPSYLLTSLQEARNGEVSRRVRLPKVEGQVAVIPIHGMITQRGSVWDDIFGGTSTQKFESAFTRAYNNDRIGAVVLDVDSPGGTTPGVQLAADRVFSTRGGSKPVVAVVNSMADSAAYWMASAAESFVSVPGGWSIGSIGVYRMHEDVSGALAQQGVKVSFISKPEYKVEGNPYEPLSEEGRAFQQEAVNATYEKFNGSVAKHRAVTPAHARDNFGKGRDFNAEQAAQMGLIDRVASMEQIMRELGVGNGKATVSQAAAKELTEELCSAWESGVVDELVFRPKTQRAVERRKTLLDKRISVV